MVCLEGLSVDGQGPWDQEVDRVQSLPSTLETLSNPSTTKTLK